MLSRDDNELRANLIRDEGVRHQPYQDSVGVWTVGVGHNLNVPLSSEAVQQVLSDDIEAAYTAAATDEWFDDLPVDVQRVVVEICFQLGRGGWAKFTLARDALRRHDWHRAADELLDSRAARQTPERWRRHAERVRAHA